MNERALVPLQAAVAPMSLDEMMSVGKTLAASGFFRDATDASKAVAKILYGAEMGIAPVSAMTGIHIVEGKPSLSAPLIATLVKRSGRYNYRVKRHDNEACVIDFFEHGQLIGTSPFTKEDAMAANLWQKPVWKAYPRNMLFARALSNGARWYCADIFGGSPVYTPEELGADIDEDGYAIEAVATRVPDERARTPMPAHTVIESLSRQPAVDVATGEILDDPPPPDDDGYLGVCTAEGCRLPATGFGPDAEPLCDVHLHGEESAQPEARLAEPSALPEMPDGIKNAGEFLTAAFTAFQVTPTRLEAYFPGWRKTPPAEYAELWAKLAAQMAA